MTDQDNEKPDFSRVTVPVRLQILPDPLTPEEALERRAKARQMVMYLYRRRLRDSV